MENNTPEQQSNAQDTQEEQIPSQLQHDTTNQASQGKPKSKKVCKSAGVIAFILGCIILCIMGAIFCAQMIDGFGRGELTPSIEILNFVAFLILFSIPLILIIIFWRKAKKLDKKQKLFGNIGLILAGLTIILFLVYDCVVSILPKKPSSAYQDNLVLSIQSIAGCNQYNTAYSDKYFICGRGTKDESDYIVASSSIDIYQFSDGQKIAQIDDAIGVYSRKALDGGLYFVKNTDGQKTIYELDETTHEIRSTNVGSFIEYTNDGLLGYISEDGKSATIIMESKTATISAPEGSKFTDYDFTRADKSAENGGYLVYSQADNQNGIISMADGEIKIPIADNQYFNGLLTYKNNKIALMKHDLTLLTDYLYSAEYSYSIQYTPMTDTPVYGYDVVGWSPSDNVFLLYKAIKIDSLHGPITEGFADVFDGSGNKIASLDLTQLNSTFNLVPYSTSTSYNKAGGDDNIAFYNHQKATFILSSGEIVERDLSIPEEYEVLLVISDNTVDISVHAADDYSLSKDEYRDLNTWRLVSSPQQNNTSQVCSLADPDAQTDLEFSIDSSDDFQNGATVTVTRFGEQIGKISHCRGTIKTVGYDRFYLSSSYSQYSTTSTVWFIEAKEE